MKKNVIINKEINKLIDFKTKKLKKNQLYR